MDTKLKQFAPIVVTLAMLAYLGGFSRLQIATVGVDDFMARSRKAIDALPLEIGKWEGKRQPLDSEARDLLQPNAEAMLLYVGPVSGIRTQAYYSVIQAADSRFMAGHAPMNCYPGNGYEITSKLDKIWRVGGMDVKGIEYVVRRTEVTGRLNIRNVRNFFIFPDGHFGASLPELDQAAADYRKLKYGVAQVQLVTPGELNDTQRDEIFQNLVGSERSLEMIRILRTGIPQ